MEQKGSFIGFTFDGIHSSQLGIFRTSDSNRYQTNLIPKLMDITTDLPTTTGLYYWGTNYGNREFSVSYAFFGLSERQLGQLKEFFSGKKIAPLIFDEEPYKVWSAKITGSATAKYVCFANDDIRLYAGSGQLQFTTYYPYAQSREEYLEKYTEDFIPEWREANSIFSDKENTIFIKPAILFYNLEEIDYGAIVGYESSFSNWLSDMDLLVSSDLDLANVNSTIQLFKIPSIYNNLAEWKDVSRIPSRQHYGDYSEGGYKLYNAGEMEMPFKAYYSINSTPKDISLSCDQDQIVFKDITAKNNDKYLLIDTRNKIAIGCDENYHKTNNLYTEKIVSGNFFNLPIGELKLIAPEADKLEFKYLYF